MATQSRIPVTLTAQDNALLIRLRAALEAKMNKRLTIAEIVRIALRNQALLEGVSDGQSPQI